ncbi:MAG: hypothetical protein LBR95_02555 [Azoarcus sp.]|nr:hypothetical protein [Azoarcus sp.]
MCVTAFEGINCRTLAAADLGDAMLRMGLYLTATDVIFISLTLVLPSLPALLGAGVDMLLLVKPQFEVGPEGVGKDGIVRDPALYEDVEARLRACARALQLTVRGWFNSPNHGRRRQPRIFIWISS